MINQEEEDKRSKGKKDKKEAHSPLWGEDQESGVSDHHDSRQGALPETLAGQVKGMRTSQVTSLDIEV